MKKSESSAVIALGTLVALGNFKGRKNEHSLSLCWIAVEELMRAEGINARTGCVRSRDRVQATLHVMRAAKCLGIFHGEKAGIPGDGWSGRLKLRLKRLDSQ
jgi:hypothetical protein